MRRVDWMVLGIGITAALVWTFVSGKDGFKGSNAIIVARSISVNSTIDGQVDNQPPAVGARVNTSDLLVSIHNSRIDRSRLVEFESDVDFLQREIANAEAQQQHLLELSEHYQSKAAAHAAWMLKDVRLRKLENTRQLEIAEKNQQLKSSQVDRATKLFNSKHTSSVALDTAQTAAEIAASQVELTRAQLERSQLLGSSLKNNGMFFDNGDASYWDKMIDALTLRQVDNINRIATLNAQLIRARAQADVERGRVGSSIAEEHHAPFEGMVNATYVTRGSRVTVGTSLLQVLDCANPIVIVPIPEHRIAEFAVGMQVTVYPVDTEYELPGSIKYISSGPLIGHDQTLLVQEDLTSSGVHAVVSFENQQGYNDPAQPCESAHRAVVVIHNKSAFNSAAKWVAAAF